MSFVYSRTAGMSEAIKFSPFPSPIIKGLPFLMAKILSGSNVEITPIAYAPFNFLTTLKDVVKRLFS